MNDPVLNWYVFETFAGAEWQVYRELGKQGFQVWLGWYLDDVTRGRYKSGRTRVYIEGYVFVRADRKWLRTARKVTGIQALVSNADGHPAAIADDVMAELIARLSTLDKVDLDPAPVITFEAGQHRKVTSGAFAGFLAEIARVVSIDKIEVWVNAMGQKVRITLPPHDLEAQKHCA